MSSSEMRDIRKRMVALIRTLEVSETQRKWLENDSLACFAALEASPQAATRRMREHASDFPAQSRDPFLALVSELEASTSDEFKSEEAAISIGVVCAMHEPEMAQVLRAMDEREEGPGESGDAFTYHVGWLSGQEGRALRIVTAAQHQMGMTDCAVLTTQLIRRYHPKYLIMVGVAAGHPDKTQIGDIAVPDTIYNYQSGKLTDKGFERAPIPVRVDDSLLQRIERVRDRFEEPIRLSWQGNDFGTPRIRRGAMACGYTVLNRDGTFSELNEWDRTTIAADMESYAAVRAAQLCSTTDYRCLPLVMKGIMDHGKNKSDEAKAYASYVSAQFLKAFALSELCQIVPEA